MNKRELASRTMEVLRSNNIRKPVSIKKHTFHITDDDGNTANFHVKQQNKNVIYSCAYCCDYLNEFRLCGIFCYT